MIQIRRLQKSVGLFQYIHLTFFPISLKVIEQLFLLFMDVSAFLHKKRRKGKRGKIKTVQTPYRDKVFMGGVGQPNREDHVSTYVVKCCRRADCKLLGVGCRML